VLALGAALALAYCLWHLNQIGLPDFAKRPLLNRLRERGVELEFERLRWRFVRGLVADKVILASARRAGGAQFSAEEVQLKLNHSALMHLDTDVESLRFGGGRFVLPLGETNATPHHLSIEGIEAQLRFRGRDVWIVENFEASGHGASVHVQGTLSNAWLLRRTNAPAASSNEWRRTLGKWVNELETTKFTEPPRLIVDFAGDVRHPEFSSARVRLAASGAKSRWGEFGSMVVGLRLNDERRATNGLIPCELDLRAANTRTRWGEAAELGLRVSFDQPPTNAMPQGAIWKLQASTVVTPWASCADLKAQGSSLATNVPAASRVFHTICNATVETLVTPHLKAENAEFHLSGEHTADDWAWIAGAVKGSKAHSDWADAGELSLKGRAERVVSPAVFEELGAWEMAVPLALEADVEVRQLVTKRIALDRLASGIHWRAPALRLQSLRAESGQGVAGIDLTLDVDSRRARADVEMQFDLHDFGRLLSRNLEVFFAQYNWSNAPPAVRGSIGATFPPWTKPPPDLGNALVPTMEIDGTFVGAGLQYRGVPVNRAEGRVTFTNRVWFLPRVHVERPDGILDFTYREDEKTRDYHFGVAGRVNPRTVRSLFDEDARRVMDEFQFDESPQLDGDIWGRWRAGDRLGVTARIATTNLNFRGTRWDEVHGDLTYTNRTYQFQNALVRFGDERVEVDSGVVDVARQRVVLTNALTTMSVDRITSTIGPAVVRVLQPYRFASPPAVRMNGTIPIAGGPKGWDARLEVQCRSFEWWKLRASNVSSTVLVHDELITLTNLDSLAYQGRVSGNLQIDQSPREGSRMQFDVGLTNVDLHALMADLKQGTNRLEGKLSGRVIVTSLDTWVTNSWVGFGQMKLRDGYLWDLPLFGVLSPVFEALSPGLGRSRFTSGNADFTITNNVVRTGNLEVKSAVMRLQYRGSVDFDGHLDATVKAELMRDTPILGPFVSLAFMPLSKLFEYRVKGTTDRPELELMYIPKFLTAVFHPIRSLKGIFGVEPRKPETEEPAR
jgi:hypothetical protein